MQDKCNHELVFFISLYYNKLMYYPSYVCLECGKGINGPLKEGQMCVNENQILETPEGLLGNYKDLAKIKNYYDKLKEELTKEEINNILQEEFKTKSNNKVKIKKETI